jgi:hypothetical protein
MTVNRGQTGRSPFFTGGWPSLLISWMFGNAAGAPSLRCLQEPALSGAEGAGVANACASEVCHAERHGRRVGPRFVCSGPLHWFVPLDGGWPGLLIVDIGNAAGAPSFAHFVVSRA